MNVLVINSGSSSIKYQLLDMANGSVLATGLVERIGEGTGKIKHKNAPDSAHETESVRELPIPDHKAGMQLAAELLTEPGKGVVKDTSDIDAVGHRIVHGGEYFSEPALVDDSVVEKIREVSPLAPLHNPGHIVGIEESRKLFPGIPQVVVFDTAFHQTMPSEAYIYALPYEYYSELKVRRYGFHGTSHRFVAKETAKLLGKPLSECNIITLHLGNGCSMAAVRGGKCVDTSMGLTPLAGLMMGTRCGDIDPAILAYLASQKGLSIQDMDQVMNKQSGLKGVCGSNDMRDVHAMREKGDARAQLAFDMFCYRIKHYIGAYYAVLGRVDALAFTAGIGENDEHVRAKCCEGLEPLGIAIDSAVNLKRAKGARDLSQSGGRVKVFVVPTNEELEIATQVMDVIKAG
ncbi:acetate kinase [Desulfocurvibacter africanus PCS]|uniref:Acetate kinase n=1 Tax=Desulfocurvibacter africanus PCS TaxID=1262666 RepID=M5Q0H9_DESAF|nr:acetate kinase [Desulfocurvibacter africanus]EMG36716.1 acetate kinase [Desulfocurvibacter africanus PCS]